MKNFHALSSSTVMLGELKELLDYNYNHIDFIDEPVELDLIVLWICTAVIREIRFFWHSDS
jgi:hypothetical protein